MFSSGYMEQQSNFEESNPNADRSMWLQSSAEH